MDTKPKDRLRQIFKLTVDSGLNYNGELDEIDFYVLFCKATANNQLYKLFSCNLCMFNYKFEGEDSVLIIFSIPVNVNENEENKHISERIMDVLKTVEECFSFVDHMVFKNVKEDKFSYLTIIKKIKDEE